MKANEGREAHQVYVREIATHLFEMQVGERRTAVRIPATLSTTNLDQMLKRWGWFKGMHYLTGTVYYNEETGVKYPVKDRPRFFIKVRQPATAKKLKPVDMV